MESLRQDQRLPSFRCLREIPDDLKKRSLYKPVGQSSLCAIPLPRKYREGVYLIDRVKADIKNLYFSARFTAAAWSPQN